MGNGAVNFQHRSRVEWDSYLALMATTQVRDIFAFKDPRHKYYPLYIIVLYGTYFSPLQVKINLVNELHYLSLLLGLLEWLRTNTIVSMVVNLEISDI